MARGWFPGLCWGGDPSGAGGRGPHRPPPVPAAAAPGASPVLACSLVAFPSLSRNIGQKLPFLTGRARGGGGRAGPTQAPPLRWPRPQCGSRPWKGRVARHVLPPRGAWPLTVPCHPRGGHAPFSVSGQETHSVPNSTASGVVGVSQDGAVPLPRRWGSCSQTPPAPPGGVLVPGRPPATTELSRPRRIGRHLPWGRRARASRTAWPRGQVTRDGVPTVVALTPRSDSASNVRGGHVLANGLFCLRTLNLCWI